MPILSLLPPSLPLDHLLPTVMNKDNGSSLGSNEKLRVTIGFVFKETEEKVLKFFLMMRIDEMIFSCPTNNIGWCPTENLEGSKSGIREGKEREGVE